MGEMVISSKFIIKGLKLYKSLDAKKKRGMHVSMATEKRTLTIKLSISLEIMINKLSM